jgi:hypothetical protein
MAFLVNNSHKLWHEPRLIRTSISYEHIAFSSSTYDAILNTTPIAVYDQPANPRRILYIDNPTLKTA